MTKIELVNLLEDDEDLRNEIAEGLRIYEEGTKVPHIWRSLAHKQRFNILKEYILKKVSKNARVYLMAYFKDATKNEYDYLLPSPLRSEFNSTLQREKEIPYDQVHEIYQDVKDESLKKIVAPVTFRKERERRNNIKFDENAQTVKLDMFSYQIFKKHVEAKKRKLSGKDCAKYLLIIPKHTSEKECTIRTKYLKLLWDSTSTKSVAFIDKLRWEHYTGNIKDSERPFTSLRADTYAIEDTAAHVEVSFGFIRNRAAKFNIPLQINTHYITESRVYKYVTGVPRKTDMSRDDVIFAMDKLLILEVLKSTNAKCPYFDMLINDLNAELSKPNNAKLLKEHYIKTNVLAAQQITENTIENIISEFDTHTQQLKEKENE